MHGKGVIDICYRTQPSDPDVRRSRAIFYAKIRDVVRHIRPALLQMPGITIDGVDVKNRCDGRKDRALQPSRRFSLCIDGGLHPKQTVFARYVVKEDRGKFVGSPEAYEKLAVEVFGKANVKTDLREDLFYIPYSLVIMVLEKAKA